jgi:hypothetical protein
MTSLAPYEVFGFRGVWSQGELKKLTEEGDLRNISRVEEHMTVTVLSTDRILTPHVT